MEIFELLVDRVCPQCCCCQPVLCTCMLQASKCSCCCFFCCTIAGVFPGNDRCYCAHLDCTATAAEVERTSSQIAASLVAGDVWKWCSWWLYWCVGTAKCTPAIGVAVGAGHVHLCSKSLTLSSMVGVLLYVAYVLGASAVTCKLANWRTCCQLAAAQLQ